jgi:hypothetical protein
MSCAEYCPLILSLLSPAVDVDSDADAEVDASLPYVAVALSPVAFEIAFVAAILGRITFFLKFP